MRRALFVLGFASVFAFACASKPEGSIDLLVGGEADAMTREPALVSLLVETVDSAGAATQLTRVGLPATTIDLGNPSQDTVAQIRVTAFDANGTARVKGTSVAVQLGGLAGTTLELFVQRTGELARLPSPLSDARPQPLVASVAGRYLFAAGGADASLTTTTQLYDLATYTPAASPPVLPRAPKSMALFGTVALLVDEMGATWFSLADSTKSVAAVPNGGSFAEVAGGATVNADDGSRYIVGGTRTTGDPTARVLRLDGTTGAITFVALTTPRLGATATWVVGRGLVVAGGSATGAGIELVSATATSATALAFPPDPTVGAGAAPLDGARVLLAGGVDAAMADAKLRVVDLGCASACAPSAFGPSLAAPLARAQAFALGDGSALVVGDDAMGATHAARVSPTKADDVPLRAARSGARAVLLATGAIAIVGGAQVVETFVP